MLRDGLFQGLPAELSPPEVAAERIAALKTRAEREAFWLRVPEGWRYFIGHAAALYIGLDITKLPTLDERRSALEQVPPIWRAEVEWRVTHLWNSKELREMSDADFRVRYPEARFRDRG